MSKLVEHTKTTHEAINILIKSELYGSALVLFYSWIDRMAWLSTDKEISTGVDFKNWVNSYLLPDRKLPCSADDLWAARCSVLHTLTSYSRDTEKGRAKRIKYFFSNAGSVESKLDDVVFIDFYKLYLSAIRAVSKFDDFLRENEEEKSISDYKMEIFFSIEKIEFFDEN